MGGESSFVERFILQFITAVMGDSVSLASPHKKKKWSSRLKDKLRVYRIKNIHKWSFVSSHAKSNLQLMLLGCEKLSFIAPKIGVHRPPKSGLSQCLKAVKARSGIISLFETYWKSIGRKEETHQWGLHQIWLDIFLPGMRFESKPK